MQLIRLRVENFAGIGSADIEFGPGLNILFGPNELGKSSLADAVRAVLLVQHTSAVASAWVPWNTERLPEVELVFQSEPAKIWRVQKTFGDKGKSRLDSSKDAVSYSKECEAREVHSRLRKLLRWGVAESAKGLPESFLTQAILPPQDRVTEFLDKGLLKDGDDSAKAWLHQVLQAVAADPLFKKVLEAADAKFREAFTPAGKYGTKQSSPLVQAKNEVLDVDRQVGEAQKKWQETETVQTEIQQKKEEQLALEATLEEHLRRRDLLRQGAAIQARLRDEREACRKIEEAHAEVEKLAGLEQHAAQGVERRTAEKESATAALVQAEGELETARQRVAQLENNASEATRQVRQKTLENDRLKLQAQAAEIDSRGERFERATAVSAKAAQSAQELAKISSEQARLADDLARRTADAERLRGTLAWIAWNEAAERVAQALARKKEVDGWVLDARKREDQLRALHEQAAGRTFPAPAAIEALRQLWGDLKLAEQMLDVGLAVEVTPLDAVSLKVSLDGEKASSQKLRSKAASFDAEREMKLVIGDLAEVTIRGGHPDARQKFEALQARWAGEGKPALKAAKAKNLAELASLAAEHSRHGQEIRELERAIEQLKSQIGRSGDPQQELSEAERIQREREGDLAGQDRKELARQAKAYEAIPAAKRAPRVQSELAGLLKEAEDARLELARVETRRESLAASAAACQGEWQSLEKDLPADWRQLAGALPAQRSEAKQKLTAIEQTLASLGQEASQTLTAAQQAAGKAEKLVAERKQACELLDIALRKAQADLIERQAERKVRRETVEKLDLAGQRVRVAGLEADLKKLANLPHEITPDLVQSQEKLVTQARQALEQLRSTIDRQQGALSQVGGDAAREKLEGLNEALARKRDQLDDVTREYDAWKLLRDALETAEKSQSTHLGQALMKPLSDRLSSLSRGKHQGLELGPALDLTQVNTGGGLRDWRRLSMGARDQLATLFRVALAEQLGSFVLLDDQLAQSDEGRLKWFRQLLLDGAAEKKLQIIVLTCRPADYLLESEMPPAGSHYGPSQSVRAVSLLGLMKPAENS